MASNRGCHSGRAATSSPCVGAFLAVLPWQLGRWSGGNARAAAGQLGESPTIRRSWTPERAAGLAERFLLGGRTAMPSRGSIFLRALSFAAVVAAILAVTAGPLFAMHRQTPFLVNLSDYPGGYSTQPGPPQGEPNHVYFQSASDLKNNGSTG